jgi:hypothetical protein
LRLSTAAGAVQEAIMNRLRKAKDARAGVARTRHRVFVREGVASRVTPRVTPRARSGASALADEGVSRRSIERLSI